MISESPHFWDRADALPATGGDVDLIRGGYDAWNRGDLAGLLGVLHADIEWHFPERGLNAGVHRGHAAVRQFMQAYADAFDELRFTPLRFVQSGTAIAVEVHMTGRGRGSGLGLDATPTHVWTMEDEKALRIEIVPRGDATVVSARRTIG
jgi:ketosteroid isomerase-like protein